ncbi:MAG: right-handed parallel beta-helix repeat-containing protein [Eubacterium sp.]
MKRTTKLLGLILLFFAFALALSAPIQAKKDFTLSTSSKPYKNKYVKTPVYNKYTKHYLTIRSYLDVMSKNGGGTLTIKKGTYNITNALLVPSNVKIVLQDGVIMNKISNSHTKKLKAGHIVFECVRSSRINKKNVVGKYDGEKNIQILGKGTVIINLDGCNKSEAIRVPHCSNVLIDNITFTNLRDGHFIEVTASKDVTIQNCTFKDNKNGERCAINLDTPDKVTNGFNGKYSKFDKTPVLNVTIQNCGFYNLHRGIDTHRFSPNKYHTNVQVLGCTFKDSVQSPIMMLNWKNAVIKGNTFDTVKNWNTNDIQQEKFAIFMRGGVIDPIISENQINGVYMPFYAKGHKEAAGDIAAKYPATYNSISDVSIESMKNNTLGDACILRYFAINHRDILYIAKSDKHYDQYDVANVPVQ